MLSNCEGQKPKSVLFHKNSQMKMELLAVSLRKEKRKDNNGSLFYAVNISELYQHLFYQSRTLME